MDTTGIQQALKPDTVLDSGKYKYTIVKVLGAGSFGITYMAKCSTTFGNIVQHVTVAIKEHFMNSCYRDSDGIQVQCTPASKAEVQQSRKDFVTEAKRLQKICTKSRNIVHVNETFEANGTAYYVMEYLNGGNPSKCSEYEAVQLVITLARAIALIHNEKVLHLDIKPDNIVMNTDPATGEVYPVLIDFGVSKHFNPNGKPTSLLTAKGASDGYAPQEQYGNITEFSPKYDVYALGALLFYLLTGTNPPIAFKISLSQKEIIESMPADVSEQTKRAILSAMNPNIEARTPDMDHLVADLSQTPPAGGGTKIITRQPSSPERNKRYILWGAIAIIAVLGAIVAILLTQGKAEKTIQPEPEELATPVEEVVPVVIEDVAMDTAVYDSLPSTPTPNHNIVEQSTPQPQNQPQSQAQPQREQQPQPASHASTGSVKIDGGVWYGGTKGGKADGMGKIKFTSSTSYYGYDVHPGYTLEGEYNNGRLVYGQLYDENHDKIKTIMP